MNEIDLNPPGNQFTLEQATWRDLNAVRLIEKACFPQDAWPLWDIIGVLTFPNIVRLKALIDGQVVGFIAGDPRPVERLAWIATVGVLPEYRNRGIGTALLKAMEAKLTVPRLRLCVRISNESAIQLYNHLDYQRIDTWKRYYGDGEDAVIMEKLLS
jgi:ribosomal protein S18 acetylase RimI-like enzyme